MSYKNGFRPHGGSSGIWNVEMTGVHWKMGLADRVILRYLERFCSSLQIWQLKKALRFSSVMV